MFKCDRQWEKQMCLPNSALNQAFDSQEEGNYNCLELFTLNLHLKQDIKVLSFSAKKNVYVHLSFKNVTENEVNFIQIYLVGVQYTLI